MNYMPEVAKMLCVEIGEDLKEELIRQINSMN